MAFSNLYDIVWNLDLFTYNIPLVWLYKAKNTHGFATSQYTLMIVWLICKQRWNKTKNKTGHCHNVNETRSVVLDILKLDFVLDVSDFLWTFLEDLFRAFLPFDNWMKWLFLKLCFSEIHSLNLNILYSRTMMKAIVKFEMQQFYVQK